MEGIMTAVLAALFAGACVLARGTLKHHMFADMPGACA